MKTTLSVNLGLLSVLTVVLASGCSADDLPTDSIKTGSLPPTRSQSEVCSKWNSDFPAKILERYYTRGATDCDPGTINPQAQKDALNRLNLYRWLVGSSPVGLDIEASKLDQAAAVMMDRQQALSHSPGKDWACYSEQGAAGAGSSDLGYGIDSPAVSISGYLVDTGDNNSGVGHRRWALYPQLGDIGLGQYGVANAMRVFNTREDAIVTEFTAFPASGHFPIQALSLDDPGIVYNEGPTHRWSFSSPKLTDPTAVPKVWITQLPSGKRFQTTAWKSDHFADTIVFEKLEFSAGQRFLIEIEAEHCRWTYQTELVSCSQGQTESAALSAPTVNCEGTR